MDDPFLANREYKTNAVINIIRKIKSEITLDGSRTLSFVPFSVDDICGVGDTLEIINYLCEKGFIKRLPNSNNFANATVEIIDESAFENYYKLITKRKDCNPEDERDFWFDDLTFKLKVPGGDPKAINFSPSNTRGTDCYHFMRAIVALLKREGVREGKWLKASFTREDVVKMIFKLFEKTVYVKWIDDTKGNWKKIVPKDWDGYIELSNFDRSSKGYEFMLKMP
ncbi:MAG: hypothetical protein WCV58_00765 [Patescibacteria group bacterium]